MFACWHDQCIVRQRRPCTDAREAGTYLDAYAVVPAWRQDVVHHLKACGALREVHCSDVYEALELGVDMVTQEPGASWEQALGSTFQSAQCALCSGPVRCKQSIDPCAHGRVTAPAAVTTGCRLLCLNISWSTAMRQVTWLHPAYLQSGARCSGVVYSTGSWYVSLDWAGPATPNLTHFGTTLIR